MSFIVNIDQLGRSVTIKSPVTRIICLVPSITELLVVLGLGDLLVGITKYCVRPLDVKHGRTLIGGTKDIDLNIIGSLDPDLVIASKEENVREQIDALSAPVWVSDVSTLQDALDMILSIGIITGREVKTEKIIKKIGFPEFLGNTRKSVAYLIWRKPYMTIGGDTFINEMLSIAGFDNVFENEIRYPIVTLDDIERMEPDYIFLSSEPFPFTEKFVKEFEHIAKPILVDGEMFSWFGSRMIYAIDYFKKINTECN